MIPVLWLDAHPLCWDQAILDDLFAGKLWPGGFNYEHHVDRLPEGTDGAVVVVPARYHSAAEVNDIIRPLQWVVLCLTSDEESTFPWAQVEHPNMVRWIQTPRPGVHMDEENILPVGYPPDTPELVTHGEKSVDWFLSGQANHEHRRRCFAALRKVPGGEAIRTEGFTRGLARPDYLARLSAAKVAPCPSGPKTPDTFRVWEALEAGCVPLADYSCPAGVHGFWRWAFRPPFPVVTDWGDTSALMERTLADLPRLATRTAAWWLRYKRDLVARFTDHLALVSDREQMSSPITVLIPTSPVPSNPSTDMIDQTIASVRHWLPEAEVILMCDGVRPEQEHRRTAYEEFLARVVRRWPHVLPMVHDEHQHQANMTRSALELVRTPFVLFVEHDTPLVTAELIDWYAITEAIRSGEVDLVRLHHEAVIPTPHWRLMVGSPDTVAGCPLLRTKQWSQRPHVASTAYYRRIITEHFPPTCSTMIEDRMHGIAQVMPWGAHRLAIYAPGGSYKRSLNLDGREDDPKYDMRFA